MAAKAVMDQPAKMRRAGSLPLCVAWMYSIVAAGIDAAAVRLLVPGEDSGTSVLCAPPLQAGRRVRARFHGVAVLLSLRGGEEDGEGGEEEEDVEDYERLREMKLRKNQVDDVKMGALMPRVRTIYIFMHTHRHTDSQTQHRHTDTHTHTQRARARKRERVRQKKSKRETHRYPRKSQTRSLSLSLPPSLSLSCLLYTSPSPRDLSTSRMPSSA